MSSAAGGFEYRGRGFRFQEGHCSLEPDGSLFLEATGQRCELCLEGVPFPGVTNVAELPGRIWDPDEEELSRHADTFAEGGLKVGARELWIVRGRIECRRFDAERSILTVSFRLLVRDGEYGREDEVDGMVHCQA